MKQLVDAQALHRALRLRDLTNPEEGPHAMQLLVTAIGDALCSAWQCRVVEHRTSPLIAVSDNYDRLGYSADAAARDSRYSRYVRPQIMLRSQMSAAIPAALRLLSSANVHDTLLLCPGLVYRRDCIDRLHVGEPHQLDLWRVHAGARLRQPDLRAMVERVVIAALPGAEWRVVNAEHPYTEEGLQIDVLSGSGWVEIGECGLASPRVLREAGLSPSVSGLAMGLGLDRILMLRKGVDDIRLLRSDDPRVAQQLLDLSPYKPVSRQPAIQRDLSLIVDAERTAEALGDTLRSALGGDAELIESLTVLDETPHGELPEGAQRRMGSEPHQKNVLLRLVIRHPTRSIARAEANALRNQVYTHLHEGTQKEWA